MAQTAIAYDIAGHVSRAVRNASDLVQTIQRRRTRQSNKAALEGLTSAQLSDLGLTRLQIFLMR